MTGWNPAGSGGSREPPARRSHTRLWIGLGGGLALVVVIAVVAAVVLLKGPNVPAGTPNHVLPGDAAKVISAVKSWAGQCSAYTDGPVSYTVAAAPPPGLGNESGLGAQYILLARAGSDGLVMVDCDMSAGDAPPSLVPIARAMVAKL